MIVSYKNNFGELNEQGLTLIVNDRETNIDIKNLVKIRFVKRQKYHINYMSFLLSIYMLFFLKNNELCHFDQLIISSIAIVLLVTSCFFKTFQYRFVLIKKNYLTEIIVSKKMSNDAENLAYQINKKIVSN
jgi:hypothetical protein